jgi:hypothetical protein
MKKMIAALIAASALSFATAGVAQAAPAICSGHSDNGSEWGMPPGNKYVTACGGDSGPDALGNNATAPHISNEAR